jgi:hypothetical protein
MYYRRTRHWLSQFSWWAILAAVLVVWTLVAVVYGWPIEQVMGFGLAGVVLAILSLKER